VTTASNVPALNTTMRTTHRTTGSVRLAFLAAAATLLLACGSSSQGGGPTSTGDSGVGDAQVVASCTNEGQSCAGAACCEGLTCDPSTRQCMLPQGAGCGGTDCVDGLCEECSGGYCDELSKTCETDMLGYGESCSSENARCADGLVCDSVTVTCLLGYGVGCEGKSCAAPFTCDASNERCSDACSPMGGTCSGGGCCGGLACDADVGQCLPTLGTACSGLACASPYTCDQSTAACAANACASYGESCSGGCCFGLVCDSAANQCKIADGYPCGEKACAAPDTCSSIGLCATATCVAYGSPCGTEQGTCCGGLDCDSETRSCVMSNYFCGGRSCGYGSSCDAKTGICGACSSYGYACADAPCCNGLACDPVTGYCAVAYEQPCGSMGCAGSFNCDTSKGVCD